VKTLNIKESTPEEVSQELTKSVRSKEKANLSIRDVSKILKGNKFGAFNTLRNAKEDPDAVIPNPTPKDRKTPRDARDVFREDSSSTHSSSSSSSVGSIASDSVVAAVATSTSDPVISSEPLSPRSEEIKKKAKEEKKKKKKKMFGFGF